MIFSSVIFLFFFLPITLGMYYLASPKWKNIILLLASLFFYAWGEPKYVILMLITILINYLFALYLDFVKTDKAKKLVLTFTILANLGILIYFKYFNFIIDNFNRFTWHTPISIKKIALPIGISFFIFQSMSYVIDCYRGHGKVQKNPINIALYISLFPQLIAGPIVRYESIAEQLEHRTESVSLFAEGVKRFMAGLAKKTLIANTVALIADTAFDNVSTISVSMAWLGAIAYTLQIYFDFSGYSDMAIGLGKMFGFEFLENFNFPYISKSITEFWRRWHISLSTWFRDYIYIPLGGNRKGLFRQYVNIGIVWLLTGIWHGANWTFIAWGVYYCILLIIEKTFLLKALNKCKVINHLYTIILFIIGWVLFRADSLSVAINYIKVMFCAGGRPLLDSMAITNLYNYKYILLAGILCSTPIFKKVFERLYNVAVSEGRYRTLSFCFCSVIYLLLSLVTISGVVSSTYNPFIYFNF